MPPQQAQAATAEVGEGRERAKGNAAQQTRVRTQGRGVGHVRWTGYARQHRRAVNG